MEAKRILIINPYGIGDVLFTLPVIENLRRACPGAFIGYLANRRTAPLLESQPGIDRVFIYERDEFVETYRRNPLEYARKGLSFLGEIRRQAFEEVYDFSLNSTFGFLSAACGIRKRVGFDYRNRGRFLTHPIPLSGYENRHVIEYYLDLLRQTGTMAKMAPMKVEVPSRAMEWARAWLAAHDIDPAQRPLIAAFPGGGASWGKAAGQKRWPAAQYAELIDKIVENFDAAFILMGDQKEQELCREVVQLADFPVHLAVGEASLLETAALLQSCYGAILNDGGPLHLAVAVGTRTVSIFGPVDPCVYGPYPAGNHIVVQKYLACQPCYRRFRKANCSHINCLRKLSVEEVYEQARGLLER